MKRSGSWIVCKEDSEVAHKSAHNLIRGNDFGSLAAA